MARRADGVSTGFRPGDLGTTDDAAGAILRGALLSVQQVFDTLNPHSGLPPAKRKESILSPFSPAGGELETKLSIHFSVIDLLSAR